MLSLLPTFARAVGSIPFVEENVENRLSHHAGAVVTTRLMPFLPDDAPSPSQAN
jgi:hypothetical protein